MPTLHVVGDSISQYYGPYLGDYLAGTLDYSRKEGMPGDPDDANGANGGDSSAVLRYLSACKERGYHWDYLLLNCGLHDLRTYTSTGAKQIAPDTYRSNLRAIVTVARSLATHILWVRTSPVVDAIHNAQPQPFRRYAADVDAYNGVADAVMQESGIPGIDLFTFTTKLGDGVFLDHAHFVEPARQLQAAFIAGYLCAVCAQV